jgi:hypothetical protein
VAASGHNMAELRTEYRAFSGAQVKAVSMYVGTSAAQGAANDNLQLALDQSEKVGRTGAPLVNRYYQWGQSQLGGQPLPNLTQFETYIYTASREYAKVVSGASMSVQGITDSAAKEASKLLNAAQSPEQFKAAATAMQNDMVNVRTNWKKQIDSVSKTIGDFLSATVGDPGTGATTGAAKDPLGIR